MKKEFESSSDSAFLLMKSGQKIRSKIYRGIGQNETRNRYVNVLYFRQGSWEMGIQFSNLPGVSRFPHIGVVMCIDGRSGQVAPQI